MLRRILAITQKEFIQTMRDRTTLMIMLSMPLLQLILFAYAIHMDVKNIPLVVADQSMDQVSQSYITDMVRSGYFNIVDTAQGEADMIAAIDAGSARAGLVIPPDFAAQVDRGSANVLLLVDGSDPFTTQSAYNAANAISQTHAVSLAMDNLSRSAPGISEQDLSPLTAHISILYNPDLKDLWFLIPGMIAMLLQTQTIALTSLAVVREREAGTIEQILVSPIRPVELMIGKTLPNLLIALINMLTIVVVGALSFGVPFQGNFPLFLGLALIYVFSGLGLGLLISSVSQNPRQAQQLNMMFSLVGLIISGFIFPRYTMPAVLQGIGYIFPLTFFIPISRGIFTKGIGIEFLWGNVAALVIFAIGIIFFASRFFRQRLD
jgi:ABC-2 type transport system permease protein